MRAVLPATDGHGRERAQANTYGSVGSEEFRDEERPGWASLLPTAATIAALAIAVALVLDQGSFAGRAGVARPADRSTVVVERRARATSDEYVWYIVDNPVNGKRLREALTLVHGGPVYGDVLVVMSTEDEALAGRSMSALANVRASNGLPPARVVDLRNH